MEIQEYALIEKTKGGATRILKRADWKEDLVPLFKMVDDARGCHCKTKEECSEHFIHSKFKIVKVKTIFMM